MLKVTRDVFEQMVWEAVDNLPPILRSHITNLEIVVRSVPTTFDLAAAHTRPNQILMGLYQGVPLVKRDTHYELVPPDVIVIFQLPHEQASSSMEDLAALVTHTVHHEIAHHFGINDKRLRELGAY